MPKDHILTDRQIVDCLAAGQPQVEAAKTVGLTQQAVSYRAKKLRAEIEARALEYYATAVPKSTEINQACLDKAKEIYSTIPADKLSDHSLFLNQAHKISDRVLQAVGIVPSGAPATVVQTIIQVQGDAILSPQVVAMFRPEALAELSGSGEDEAIDVDWILLDGSGDEIE